MAPPHVAVDTAPARPQVTRRRNAEVDWGAFDPDWYRAYNYGILRHDDRTIISHIRSFFAGASIPPDARGVDVGSGANLYPSFAMLPFCRRIKLIELSSSNASWLRTQVRGGFDRAWDPFWTAFHWQQTYRTITDPRSVLARHGRVDQASVFDLPNATWDVGTMFFVACSISTELDEFHRAVHRFVRSLKPDAPFAAAFMDHSEGYVVNGIRFPAVQVGQDDVQRSLAPIAYNVKIERISSSTLRDGYRGMILAWGRARPTILGTAISNNENPTSPAAP